MAQIIKSTACVSKPSRSWRFFVFEHLIPLRPAALESPWRLLVQLHRVHCALLIEEQAFRGGSIRLRRLDLARNALPTDALVPLLRDALSRQSLRYVEILNLNSVQCSTASLSIDAFSQPGRR